MIEKEEWGEDFVLNTGVVLRAHKRAECIAPPCPLHSPSLHHMRNWPQIWRLHPPFDLRRIFERQCPHGIGHPDPDDFKIRHGRDSGMHGCDGCCQPPDYEFIDVELLP